MGAELTAFFVLVKKQWANALLLSLLAFGLYSGLQTLDDDTLNELATNTNTSKYQNNTVMLIGEKASLFWLWGFTFNNLNPSYRYNLPFTDKYIIPINDIPYFDSTDLIIVLPLAYLFLFIAKYYWKKSPKFEQKFLIILFYILIVLLFWLLTKFFYYRLYLWASTQLGLTIEEAIQIRENFLENLDTTVKGTLFFVSVFGGLALYSKFKKKKR